MVYLFDYDLNKLPCEQTEISIRIKPSKVNTELAQSSFNNAEQTLCSSHNDSKVLIKLPNYTDIINAQVHTSSSRPFFPSYNDVVLGKVVKSTLEHSYQSGPGKRSHRNYLVDAFVYCALRHWECYLFSKPGKTPVQFRIMNTEMLLRCIDSICLKKNDVVDKTIVCSLNEIDKKRLIIIKRWFVNFPNKIIYFNESFVITVEKCSQVRMLKTLQAINSIVISDSAL